MSGRSFVSRFSPNRTDPRMLEDIFVQRHRLAKVWLDRLRDGVMGGAKHHLLAVGPRGCGKSHLVTLLVHRLKQEPTLTARMRVARLPEDETTPSFWKLLLRILRALHAEYGGEFAPFPPEQLALVTTPKRGDLLAEYLLGRLGDRTLVLVIENLDDVMRGLKSEGQKRWRAFLQEHPVITTLATAQQLTDDLSKRSQPFFNFFQVENLLPLSAEEAHKLLCKLAKQNNNADLLEYLEKSVGRARVRAVRHLTGGSHRVFIIMSEFVTREALDNLVVAFEELLDELTPYYQERLRWLPDQQREIVEFLCRQVRTTSVKAIAEGLYLTEQTAAAQLKSLKDKRYVVAATVGRESRYELAEPMMRLCVEVKDPQREPIRLIVEFLRIWYDHDEVAKKLSTLSAEAKLERQYLNAVLQAQKADIPGAVEEALDRDLEEIRHKGDREAFVRALIDSSMFADSASRCLKVADELGKLGEHEKALDVYERAIRFGSENSVLWSKKAVHLTALKRFSEVISLCEAMVQSGKSIGFAWAFKALALYGLEQYENSLAAAECAAKHGIDIKQIQFTRADSLQILGRFEEALVAAQLAIDFEPQDVDAWLMHGFIAAKLKRFDEAAAGFQHVLSLETDHQRALQGLAAANIMLGRWDEAEAVLMRWLYLLDTQVNNISPFQLEYCLASLFLVSTEKASASTNVTWIVECVEKAQQETSRRHATAKPTHSSEVLPVLGWLGSALILTLHNPAYDSASQKAIQQWTDAWHEASKKRPNLSLTVRIFEVGMRYRTTQDERVLLDLVQEERSVLTNLFGLKTDEPSR